MSQRPAERKHIQRAGRRENRAVTFFRAIRFASWSDAHFRTRSPNRTLNVCVTTGSLAVGLMSLYKCMQARLPPSLPPPRKHRHTFMQTHTRPSFHSCKYTLLTHFFKGNKKKKPHWITAGQWVKAGHHGNKLRGTGAGCVYVGRRRAGVCGAGFG